MVSYCAKCGKSKPLIKKIPPKYIELGGSYLPKKGKQVCGTCLQEIIEWIILQVKLFNFDFHPFCPLSFFLK